MPLSADGVLVHIGPYKTGTTAIQSSLHQHRDDLAGHGVWYPGPRPRQFREGWSLLGRSQAGAPAVGPEEWERLAEGVRGRAGQRVCLSSEDFVSAGPRIIEKLVTDLGQDRVHMVVVARRLDKLIPSAWQQRIKSSNETRTFEQFVSQIVSPERKGRAARAFWWHHDFGPVVDRWLDVLPPERVTVIVADEGDREQLLRVFESLLGLSSGVLTPGPRDNSSLTWERTELYRQLNEAFDKNGWADTDRRQMMHNGLLLGLMGAERTADEVAIPSLPSSVDTRLTELSDERSDRVAAFARAGVHVIGDPMSLRYVPPVGDRDVLAAPPETMPIVPAARAVEGLLGRIFEMRAGREKRIARLRARVQTLEEKPLDGISSKALLREVVRRQRRRWLRR